MHIDMAKSAILMHSIRQARLYINCIRADHFAHEIMAHPTELIEVFRNFINYLNTLRFLGNKKDKQDISDMSTIIRSYNFSEVNALL